ncbi:NADPH-dependent diflavin oxidoreductase 1 [Thelohanellus kitauei]|uniref:NADPH-dependent diflavin oxidoreductase 1 n=1 Tax=Thelohanellus kitauei TaxID=669202 RepID=A0A0C2J3M6_THEKT|nr:NADPH-dependent diflavin oxidoreductase 1 [Thelohanellus kitauei]
MDEYDFGILIIYGTETGNSEDYAFQLFDQLKHLTNVLISEADSLSDFNIISSAKYLVFVVSTSGQGTEPRNFKKFWKFLLNTSIPNTWLQRTSCAVLALGDSIYQRYNYCGKRLYRRLLQFGCKMLTPLCLANEEDPNGSDTQALPWIETIVMKMKNFFPDVLRPKLVEIYTVHIKFYDIIEASYFGSLTPVTTLACSILDNKRITDADHFQQINLIDVENRRNVQWVAGSVLRVFPKNELSLVSKLESLLEIDCHKKFNIKFSNGHPIEFVTLHDLFVDHLDINAVPKRRFFQRLSQISAHSVEKERLDELSSSHNLEDYYSYCCRSRRNHFEVLRDFPNTSLQLTLIDVANLIPRMKPRDYSICSSFESANSPISIIVSLVKYRTVIKEPRYGTCSRYLCNLLPGDQLSCEIIHTDLKFPDPQTSSILVATGTGCASIHAFLQSLPCDTPRSKHLVFLGFRFEKNLNRNQEKDYLFREDWERFNKKNIEIFTAFSRDQSNKIYVQHRLIEQGKIVWKYIQNGCYIIVTGGSKRMPDDVYDAFRSIVCENGHMSVDEASRFMQKLERIGRYQTETY